MRTPNEKEKIILEYYEGTIGRNEICRKYGIGTSVFRNWRKKYDEYGINGLNSNTGKSTGGNMVSFLVIITFIYVVNMKV